MNFDTNFVVLYTGIILQKLRFIVHLLGLIGDGHNGELCLLTTESELAAHHLRDEELELQ